MNIHQREELRARFPGVPGDLVNFFLYIAEEVCAKPFCTACISNCGNLLGICFMFSLEVPKTFFFVTILVYILQVRGILAKLGYEKLDDIIGRSDLLKPRDVSLVKTQHLNLSYVLSVS